MININNALGSDIYDNNGDSNDSNAGNTRFFEIIQYKKQKGV